jgi:Icc-related predicted phosphoesterase
MRIVAISDMHGWLPHALPPGDVLVIPGDVVIDNFSGVGMWDRKAQAAWMRHIFAEWLAGQDYKAIIGIAGNHDFVLQGKIAEEMPWIYLEDESTEVDGVLFHGSPWVPTFGGWAFMKPDSQLPEHWDKIPESVDVLITHGPPFGYLDVTAGWEGDPPANVGSSSLRWRLENGFENLKLHLFGHIHPAYGKITVGDRIYANVSHADSEYNPVNPPMVFDI